MEQVNDPRIREKQDALNYFYDRCIDFLICACEQIKKRYGFNDPILKNVSVLKPRRSYSHQERDVTPSLLNFMKIMPRIVNVEQYQEIDDEWRLLPLHKIEDDMLNSETGRFWNHIKNIKNDDDEFLFKNLVEFALNVLSIPHSNAECERIFSNINLIKTKSRNRLITKTIDGLLLAKQLVKYGGDCTKFQASKEMCQKMTKNIIYQPIPKITNENLNYETEAEEIDEDDTDIGLPVF